MNHGFIVSEEKSNKLLTLIIDKKGILGESLLAYIDTNIPGVLVTADGRPANTNTIVVPFHKDIPEIPEGVYSHIFFVWEGENETLRLLEPLLEKVTEDNAQFLFITDYHLFSGKLFDYVHQRYAQASFVLLGDLFGNELYTSLVSSMFYETQKNGVIKLNNVGLSTMYPALFSDVVEKIVHVGFSQEKRKTFLAGYSEGITQLSVAHVLQKVEPFIKIDFTNVNEEQVVLPPTTGFFPESYPIGRKLQDSFTDFVAAKQTHTSKPILPKFSAPVVVKKQKQVTKKRRFAFLSVLLVLLLVLSQV